MMEQKQNMPSLQQWQVEQFEPWKKAAQAYRDEKQQNHNKVRQQAGALKNIVAMLLDLREREATNAWNQLGLEPELKMVQVDLAQNRLELIPLQGEVLVMDLSDMLDDLQRILES